jgi:molybdopterin converting factor small subunit
MNRQETLQALEDKYMPMLQEVTARLMVIDIEKMGIENEYKEKTEKINDYFDAVDNIERMQNLLDNPPEV